MKQAVIFGAGSVGRGFIGQLFSDSGLDVLFVDINKEVIDGINQGNSYPQIIVTGKGSKTRTIGNVSAADIADRDRVGAAICSASVIATAVGANVLRHIVPVLAQGLQQRFDRNLEPINILLCENLHNAADYMRTQLKSSLDARWQDALESDVGLLETSIGRMIPVPTEDIKSIHPAAVMVEPYAFLPYDTAAVKGQLPEIKGLVGDTAVPFSFYSDRKLYVHNMGHCFCAYLGELFGDDYIHQSIAKPFVRYFVRGAMIESATALAAKYNQEPAGIIDHVDDLLSRFDNSGLMDTLERVGREPERKMKPDDRFVGALLLAKQAGMPHRFLSLAVAAGLTKLVQTKQWDRETTWSYLQSSMSAEDSTYLDVQRILDAMDSIQSNPDFGVLNSILSQGLSTGSLV